MQPVFNLNRIGKKFGGAPVLREISLEIGLGEKVCILGPSGSGKSTLLRCLNLLETLDSGRIVLNLPGQQPLIITDRPLSSSQLTSLRTNVGMVFQGFNLWGHMTVLQNIIEAPIHTLKCPREQARETALTLLEKVGLAHKRNSYPSELSGGQQQRVAIVRALAMRPKVMLFDEPTSALDPEMVGEVLKVMQLLTHDDGMTMIVVTHEMGFAAEFADQIIFMDQGIVLETDSAKEFFRPRKTGRAAQFLSNVGSFRQ